MNVRSLSTLGGAMAMLPAASFAQTVIFSDDFNDNTITGWTFLDRNGAEEIANANWVETGGRLEQQTDNYDFIRDLQDDPSLGTIALAPVKAGGHYSITATLISLEPTNGFQDEDIVFGYVDADNFFYLETIASSGANLFQVFEGDRSLVTGGPIVFSHDPVVVTLEHESETGTVTVTYGDEAPREFVDPIFIRNGEHSVGVGSNNDAFAIDDFSITSIAPVEPTSLEIVSLNRDPDTGDTSITWTSIAGTEYFLEKSADLSSWIEVDDVTGAPGTTTLVDSAQTAESLFYRVRAEE